MRYTLEDLLVFGKRSGNPKRSYLLIDPLQAKHLAVSPAKALEMMDALGEKLALEHPDTGCIIGFAETATAIAAAAARHFPPQTVYMQTTREPIIEHHLVLDFSEEHSHAVRQLLDTGLLAGQLRFSQMNGRSVMLIDDEISTGSTAKNLISKLNERLPLLPRYGSGFTIGSVINRMDRGTREELAAKGVGCCSLIDADIGDAEERVRAFETVPSAELPDVPAADFTELSPVTRIPELRRGGVFVHDLAMWLDKFAEEVCAQLECTVRLTGRVLVMGTEECMLPALMVGRLIEKRCPGTEVFSHSTTRSPIGICTAEGYPIREGYRIPSFYEADRETFIYDPAEYSTVIAVTDSRDTEQAAAAMSAVTRVFSGRADRFILVSAGQK